MKHLLYVADPMCSWCYGFEPVLSAVLARNPDTQVDLVMGGLRAFHTNVMDAAMKDTLRGHWENVSKESGQPFSQALFARDDFVYNTEPACRAVVVARSQAPELALSLMRAIQTTFFTATVATLPGATCWPILPRKPGCSATCSSLRGTRRRRKMRRAQTS